MDNRGVRRRTRPGRPWDRWPGQRTLHGVRHAGVSKALRSRSVGRRAAHIVRYRSASAAVHTHQLHGYSDVPPADFEGRFYTPSRATRPWSESNDHSPSNTVLFIHRRKEGLFP